jgi:CHAT domain-containing protein
MSLGASTELVRRLDRISIDMRRRPDGADLSDLLAGANALESDVRAIDIADLSGAWHLRRADLLFRMERFAEAVSAADAAIRELGNLREADLQVAALDVKARSLDRLEDWDGLDDVCRLGIERVEQFRYSLSAPYLKSAYMRARIDLYALGVRAALQRGDESELIRRAELSKCRILPGSSGKIETGPDVQHLEQRLREIIIRINRYEAAGRTPTQLLAERRTLWDMFEAQRNTGSQAVEPDLLAIQQTLNPSEAVLYYYWIDKTHLLRIVLDRHSMVVDPIVLTADKRQALEAFTGIFNTATERLDKFVIDQIDDFHDVLWPSDPEALRLLDSVTRLIVSPHRQLHALPIGALKVNGEYVICRWALRFAPNLTTLLSTGQPGSRHKSVLTVGVRHFDVPGVPLGDLKSAPAECSEVADIYEAEGWETECLIDGDANEASLTTSAGRNPSVVHFACHGQNVEADTPLESRLYLHHSALDGLEIPLLGLSPKTVVLSACNAGQRAIKGRKMTELPGDDLLGLQSAFFAAGAREIIAALYPVEDSAAAKICPAFHRHLVGGAPVDIALTLAIREFIANARALNRRRYYWAPFFLSALGPNASGASNQN